MKEYIKYQCKCGAVYALENKVPVELHKNSPERQKCRRLISKNKRCGTPFPEQELRDYLFNMQNRITTEEE